MALVTCRECRKRVSNQAERCPHCGIAEPGKGQQPTTIRDYVIGTVVLVALLGGFWILLVPESATPPSPSRSRARGPIMITQQDLGDAWPFTVDSGLLDCRGAGEVVFTVDGRSYAVNGLAKGTKKYDDISPIWSLILTSGSSSDAKKDIGPIITRGLALCPP